MEEPSDVELKAPHIYENIAFSDKCVEFCRQIAEDLEVFPEDIDYIFNFQTQIWRKPKIEQILMRLIVEKQEYPIDLEIRNRLFEYQEDNQGNKTTALLYIANLLGYDFFNKNNQKFLSDNRIIERGKSIAKLLRGGQRAKLETKLEDDHLLVEVADGHVSVTFSEKKPENGNYTEKKFELDTMTAHFQQHITDIAAVQLMSSGREFDIQILADICDELTKAIKIVSERVAARRQDALRIYQQEGGLEIDENKLRMDKSSLEGVIEQITSDIQKKMDESDESKKTALAIEALLTKLRSLRAEDIYSSFSKMKSLYYQIRQLENNLAQLTEAKQKLLESEKNLKETQEKIQSLRTEIENDSNRLQPLQEIISEAHELLTQGFGKIHDQELLQVVIDYLNKNNFEKVREFSEFSNQEALKVLRKLIDVVSKFDSDIEIKIQDCTTLQDLKNLYVKKKNELEDYSIVGTILQDMFLKLERTSSSCEEELARLQIIINEKRDQLVELEERSRELTDLSSSELLSGKDRAIDSIQKDLAKKREELKELEKEFHSFPESMREDIDSLVESTKSLLDSEEILFEKNPEKNLMDLQTKFEDEWREIRSELTKLNLRLTDYSDRLQKIDVQLTKKEEKTDDKLTRLTKYLGMLKNIVAVLSFQDGLRGVFEDEDIERKYKQRLDALKQDRLDLKERLDSTINDMFLEKCGFYYQRTKDGWQKRKITRFDFVNREFEIEVNGGKTINMIQDISGGTASTLTALSLSSKLTSARMGNFLLVDEYNDIADPLREICYQEIRNENKVTCAIFVKPFVKPTSFSENPS